MQDQANWFVVYVDRVQKRWLKNEQLLHFQHFLIALLVRMLHSWSYIDCKRKIMGNRESVSVVGEASSLDIKPIDLQAQTQEGMGKCCLLLMK